MWFGRILDMFAIYLNKMQISIPDYYKSTKWFTSTPLLITHDNRWFLRICSTCITFYCWCIFGNWLVLVKYIIAVVHTYLQVNTIKGSIAWMAFAQMVISMRSIMATCTDIVGVVFVASNMSKHVLQLHCYWTKIR